MQGSSVVSAVQPYIPPWRRPHANPHLTQDYNVNAGAPRSDGIVQQTTAANVTTIANLLPHSHAYLAMNAQLKSQFGQAAGAQQTLAHHYRTEWEALQVQELSAEDKKIKR